ncbi:MAG: hypothetical protein RLZZ618_918 [Pseudomonadota bacterium]
MSARIAAFNARLSAVLAAAGQSSTSPFAGIALPIAPRITSYVTVANASQLATAAAMSNVEVTFTGPGFVGKLPLDSRSDQRWIFPAGFTLTAPAGDYAIEIGRSSRIELIGTGGRVVGGMFSGSVYSDLKLKGMDIRTRTNSPQVWYDQIDIQYGTRVLIDSSYIWARQYALYYYYASNFVVANSDLNASGEAAAVRTGGSDLVLLMDSRVKLGGSTQAVRAHDNTHRYAAWNLQVEGSTGFVAAPAPTVGTQVQDLVLLDNKFYVNGTPVSASHTVSGQPNVTKATIVGNHGYTNFESGSQIGNNGDQGGNWIVRDNPRTSSTTAPAWARQ